jgi:hypothetical protein
MTGPAVRRPEARLPPAGGKPEARPHPQEDPPDVLPRSRLPAMLVIHNAALPGPGRGRKLARHAPGSRGTTCANPRPLPRGPAAAPHRVKLPSGSLSPAAVLPSRPRRQGRQPPPASSGKTSGGGVYFPCREYGRGWQCKPPAGHCYRPYTDPLNSPGPAAHLLALASSLPTTRRADSEARLAIRTRLGRYHRGRAHARSLARQGLEPTCGGNERRTRPDRRGRADRRMTQGARTGGDNRT